MSIFSLYTYLTKDLWEIMASPFREPVTVKQQMESMVVCQMLSKHLFISLFEIYTAEEEQGSLLLEGATMLFNWYFGVVFLFAASLCRIY